METPTVLCKAVLDDLSARVNGVISLANALPDEPSCNWLKEETKRLTLWVEYLSSGGPPPPDSPADKALPVLLEHVNSIVIRIDGTSYKSLNRLPNTDPLWRPLIEYRLESMRFVKGMGALAYETRQANPVS